MVDKEVLQKHRKGVQVKGWMAYLPKKKGSGTVIFWPSEHTIFCILIKEGAEQILASAIDPSLSVRLPEEYFLESTHLLWYDIVDMHRHPWHLAEGKAVTRLLEPKTALPCGWCLCHLFPLFLGYQPLQHHVLGWREMQLAINNYFKLH